jgi:hypothetical protein
MKYPLVHKNMKKPKAVLGDVLSGAVLQLQAR